MTALSVVQRVCTAPGVGLEPPSTVFSSTSREVIELRDLLKEAADYVTRSHAWQTFSRVHTITGDGSTTAFNLPSDWAWMTQDQQVWSSDLEAPLTRIGSRNEWLGLDIQDFDLTYNAWVIFGDQIHFKPAPDSGVLVKFFYQSDLVWRDNVGNDKAEATADSDTLRIDERLLRLCLQWMYRAQSGLPYAEDMATYEEALSQAQTRDQGPSMFMIGTPRMPRGVNLAYPRTIDGSGS